MSAHVCKFVGCHARVCFMCACVCPRVIRELRDCVSVGSKDVSCDVGIGAHV